MDASLTPRRDYAKWALFLVLGVATLVAIAANEIFLIQPGHPEWAHIAKVKWLLLVHGLAGAAALVTGPFQFSDRIRASRVRLHRTTGYVYLTGALIAGAMGLYLGLTFESAALRPSVSSLGAAWLFTTGLAYLCIRGRHIEAHKGWMMKSYGLCLVFTTSRFPTSLPGSRPLSDPNLNDLIWGLIVLALFLPDLFLTVRRLARKGR